MKTDSEIQTGSAEAKGSEMPVAENSGMETAPGALQSAGGIGEARRAGGHPSPKLYGHDSELKRLKFQDRRARFDLGLEIARWHAEPGKPMSQTMLAEFCGCTYQYIYLIERRALRKLRRACGPALLAELRTCLEHRTTGLPCAPSDFHARGPSTSH